MAEACKSLLYRSFCLGDYRLYLVWWDGQVLVCGQLVWLGICTSRKSHWLKASTTLLENIVAASRYLGLFSEYEVPTQSSRSAIPSKEEKKKRDNKEKRNE